MVAPVVNVHGPWSTAQGADGHGHGHPGAGGHGEGARHIEDIRHLLLHCPLYRDERIIWQDKIGIFGFNLLSEEEQIKMALFDPLHLKHTANFLIKAFKFNFTF